MKNPVKPCKPEKTLWKYLSTRILPLMLLVGSLQAEPSPLPPAPQVPVQTRDIAKSLDLLEACLQGNQNLATRLLQDPAVDPNVKTHEKISIQILKSHPEIPKSLQNLLSSDSEVTPLMAAAAHGDTALCHALLSAGADRWAKTKRWKTTALWLAGRSQHTSTLQTLLLVPQDSPARTTKIFVDLANQRGILTQNGQEILEFPVSSGKKGHPTPTGNFVVSDKHRKHTSTIYHASMPFFMRLSFQDFGLHQGQLPGYPASKGCIRLNPQDAQTLFERVPIGSVVTIR